MVAETMTPREGMARGFAGALLPWYDRHARALPWRMPPGSEAKPDPYAVWLSEVMLQQTTVATVKNRYRRFLELWPRAEDLAAASLEDVLGEWAGLGYYARARNLHACAQRVAEEGWPETEEGLRDLPGLGAYTAAAVAAIAFGAPAVVVDGNVERVVARLFALTRPIKEEKSRIRALAAALTPEARAGDYAQAMMDLGATVCRPKNPDCLICPVSAFCEAKSRGIQSDLPVKAPRKEKLVRSGIVYVGVRKDGAVLCETRAEGGLYGGMAGLPGEGWSETERERPPFEADWMPVGTASHTLTHRQLELDVRKADTEKNPEGFFFLVPGEWDRLPTVFRRCLALVHSSTDD